MYNVHQKTRIDSGNFFVFLNNDSAKDANWHFSDKGRT